MPVTLQEVKSKLGLTEDSPAWMRTAWSIYALGASGACAYHGYNRHCGSIGWGLVWGFFGPIALPFAIKGFGKPDQSKPGCRLKRLNS